MPKEAKSTTISTRTTLTNTPPKAQRQRQDFIQQEFQGNLLPSRTTRILMTTAAKPGFEYQGDFDTQRLAAIAMLDEHFFFSAPPDACHYTGAGPAYALRTRPGRYIPRGRWSCTLRTGYRNRWFDRESTDLETPALEGNTAYIVIRCSAAGQREAHICKEVDILTLAKVRDHSVEAQKAMVDELRCRQAPGAFERRPRADLRNTRDARWVPEWSKIGGLRAGFGFKGALRAWDVVLLKALTDFGPHAPRIDPQVFMNHLSNKMVLIAPTRVDDLRGGGLDEERKKPIEHLEQRLGKLKT